MFRHLFSRVLSRKQCSDSRHVATVYAKRLNVYLSGEMVVISGTIVTSEYIPIVYIYSTLMLCFIFHVLQMVMSRLIL